MDICPALSADRFAGFVLGTTVGDALGLPREGMSARRALRIFGGAPLHHQLCVGYGMTSDDTEHLVLTAQSLFLNPSSAESFTQDLARRLRWWLLSTPAGGGRATITSCIKLLIGFGPHRCGVFSAGNGPAMRSGVLGLCLHRDRDPLADYVRVSTRLTHTDPLAEGGALAIAIAVRHAVRCQNGLIDTNALMNELRVAIPDPKWREIFDQVEAAIGANLSATEFGMKMGWGYRDRSTNQERLHGVSGFICHTVAAALFCWLRWPGEFRRPVEEVTLMGGDADSTAAIVGGLAGATLGVTAIPQEWTDKMIDWPTSISWLRRFSTQLHTTFGGEQIVIPQHVLEAAWILLLLRNWVFVVVVLIHVFRRMLPPY